MHSQPLTTSVRYDISLVRIYFPDGSVWLVRGKGHDDMGISIYYSAFDSRHTFSIFRIDRDGQFEPVLEMNPEDYSHASLWFVGDPYSRFLQGAAA